MSSFPISKRVKKTCRFNININSLPTVLLAECLSYIPSKQYKRSVTPQLFHCLFQVSRYWRHTLLCTKSAWCAQFIEIYINRSRRLKELNSSNIQSFISSFCKNYSFLTVLGLEFSYYSCDQTLQDEERQLTLILPEWFGLFSGLKYLKKLHVRNLVLPDQLTPLMANYFTNSFGNLEYFSLTTHDDDDTVFHDVLNGLFQLKCLKYLSLKYIEEIPQQFLERCISKEKGSFAHLEYLALKGEFGFEWNFPFIDSLNCLELSDLANVVHRSDPQAPLPINHLVGLEINYLLDSELNDGPISLVNLHYLRFCSDSIANAHFARFVGSCTQLEILSFNSFRLDLTLSDFILWDAPKTSAIALTLKKLQFNAMVSKNLTLRVLELLCQSNLKQLEVISLQPYPYGTESNSRYTAEDLHPLLSPLQSSFPQLIGLNFGNIDLGELASVITFKGSRKWTSLLGWLGNVYQHYDYQEFELETTWNKTNKLFNPVLCKW